VRVALVGPYPLDPDRIDGGPDTSFMALATALAELGDIEPQAITFVPGLERQLRKEVDGLSVTYIPAPRRFRSLALHLRERRALSRVLASVRPDLVHAQDALQYGFISLKAAKRLPVVLTIHGIAREEIGFAADPLVRLRFAIAAIPLQRYCISHARYLTHSTPYAAEYFGNRMRGRSWDIANPIPDRFFEAERSPEPGRMLHVAKVVPLKRLIDLVEAMPSIAGAVPTASLQVAGEELPSEYTRQVRSRVRALGLEERVAFRGPLSPRQLVEEYRLASVLVLPSGQENSPLTIGEAMASGVPVVATRVGGVAHLVDEGTTGHVVAPGDVSALADRIISVLGDPARVASFGAAARERAERDFRIGVVAKQMRELYEAAIAGGPS